LSAHLKFGTVECLPSRTHDDIHKALQHVFGVYHKRGFQVRKIRGDPEFDMLRDTLASQDGIDLECCNEDEHIPEIERYIRTVKERTRCSIADVPFRFWPRQLVIQLVGAAIYWLNVFPPKDGVHQTLGPRALITGGRLEHKRCRLPFGQYVHTHEKTFNDMTPRTIGALALRPHPTDQNSHLFLSLTSGRVLKRGYQSYTKLPMPEHVIAHIDALGDAADAAAGVYFDHTNQDTAYDPPSDLSSNDTDDLLPADDFAPISPAERDWILVDRQRHFAGNAGVGGPQNADETDDLDDNAESADDDDDDDNNDDSDDDTNNQFNNNPFAALIDPNDEDDDSDPTEVNDENEETGQKHMGYSPLPLFSTS
jgi:hypothetical protein